MRKIIYTQADGVLAVVHPVINTHPEREKITEEEAEQRAWDLLPKDAINPAFVDERDIPKDRTFRNAWVHGGDKAVHDIPKCKELQKERMREARAPKLAKLDVEFMKALEEGDLLTQEEVKRQKKALRDVTEDSKLASAKTVAAILKIWPDILK